MVAQRAHVCSAVTDSRLGVIVSADPDDLIGEVVAKDEEPLLRLVAACARMRRPLSLPSSSTSAPSFVVAPIVAGDEASEFLLTASHVSGEAGEDLMLMVTEHAAMVCGVLLGRARVVAAVSGRARRDLFDALLLVGERTAADVESWAIHLGLKPDRGYRVVAAECRSGDAGRTRPAGVLAIFERLVRREWEEATVVDRGDEIVAIIPVDESSAETFVGTLKRCREAIHARYPDFHFRAGVGNRHDGALHISASYTEAEHALDAARMLGGFEGVVVFADLGVRRLLAQVREVNELRSFVSDVLGKVIELERAQGIDYLNTLSVYYTANNSLQRSAGQLHMHPNTVSHRLRRVEQITGLDLSSYRDRLTVQVALEIARALGDPP